ncbi:MAG TPA: tetratricopeptide repeat protein [Methylococcaceae bacterium]|nr:tetratricopeptide repeat protein [Methylococcaceae bacterium]
MLANLFKQIFPRRQVKPDSVEESLPKDEAFAEAYTLYEANNYGGAEEKLKTLLSSQEKHLDALCLLGDILGRLGRTEESASFYRKALLVNPQYVSALVGLGLALHDQGDYASAYSFLNEARRREPRNAEVLNLIGLVSFKMGNLSFASSRLKESLKLNPDSASAWNNMGIVHRYRGGIGKAVQCFRNAVNIKADFRAALMNLGLALRDYESPDKAVECLEKALTLEPGNATVLLNYGNLLMSLGRLEEAEARFKDAIHVDPAMPELHACLGSLHIKRKECAAALGCYRHALDLHPDYPEALLGMAEIYLSQRDFAQGWKLYEARLNAKIDSPRRILPYAEWKGEPLHGKSILIYSEQGLGDVILFASCLPDVVRQASRCIVECDRRLAKLFERSFSAADIRGYDQNHPAAGRDPSVDYYAAIGSLMGFFRNVPDTFPVHSGYLRADEGRVAYWRERLSYLGEGGIRIGIAWQGGLVRTGKYQRSMPLRDWQMVLEKPGITWVSLQHRCNEKELTEFTNETSVPIHYWPESIDDLDETAALISSLDLVITVCSTLAHLTGGLGKPLWVLVPDSPSWRYLADGETLPWYPSARLFRQAQPGEWNPVLSQVEEKLDRIMGKEVAAP